ncbi:type B 50S ribosomal protein L31 [Nocardioides lentus]|uniref:50S ribosomal protein L31 n=1 Tax=Nocardioides lentus TaxID=338077 RepID=A0ABP5A8D2_9ACTN
MKKDIHPAYGPVVFRDRSADLLLLTRSTLVARADQPTVELDGATYPVVDVDVSAASHPFWTGRGRVVDTEGRVQAFERRYGRGAGGGAR